MGLTACARDHPSIQAKKPILYTLSKFWGKPQAILSPGISLLATFLWHASFNIARLLSNFAVWEEKGIIQLRSLGTGSHHIYS